jgi:hypothetical protein
MVQTQRKTGGRVQKSDAGASLSSPSVPVPAEPFPETSSAKPVFRRNYGITISLLDRSSSGDLRKSLPVPPETAVRVEALSPQPEFSPWSWWAGQCKHTVKNAVRSRNPRRFMTRCREILPVTRIGAGLRHPRKDIRFSSAEFYDAVFHKSLPGDLTPCATNQLCCSLS